MKYEEMSNYKLNRKLAWLVLGDNKVLYKDPKSEGGVLCRGMQGVIDYCTDWNATMPLAVEYGVSILSCGGDDFEISYDYHAPAGKLGTDEIFTWHMNAKKECIHQV